MAANTAGGTLFQDEHIRLERTMSGGVVMLGEAGGMMPSHASYYSTLPSAMRAYTAMLVRQIKHVEAWAEMERARVEEYRAEKELVMARVGGVREYLKITRGPEVTEAEARSESLLDHMTRMAGAVGFPLSEGK